MKTNVEKLPKSTLKISVSLENSKVKSAYNDILQKAVEETDIEGFRKGKAPQQMVIDKIGISNLYGDVINLLLKTYYPQALKETMVSPLSNPKVEIKEFDLDKDFEFSAVVAVRPETKVGDYITKLKEYYEDKKSTKSKENEEKIKKGEKIEETHTHLSVNEVLDVLTQVSEVEVPELLLEEETDRMLTRLVDQAQSIGLSLEQYLKSQNKTSEQLRQEYSKIAEKNLKAEFIMGDLVRKSDIIIEDKEIEDTLKASGIENAEERMNDLYEKSYIKSILQKNKLISNIIEQVQGEHHHD